MRIKHSFFTISTLLFLISPLVAFFYSLRNYEKKWAKNIVWAFIAFFGYIIQIPYNSTSDSAVYRMRFWSYRFHPVNVYELFTNLYSDTQHIDVIEKSISSTLAQYTNDYHFLFLMYAILFGFFYTRNLELLFINKKFDKPKSLFSLFLAIAITVPFWTINGFDFYFASQVFIFAILSFLIKNEKKYLLFLIICPLTHFSFFFPVFLFFTFLFIKKFSILHNTLFWFFIFSLLAFGISISLLEAIISNFLPSIVYNKYQVYLAGVQEKESGGRIIGAFVFIYTLVLNIVYILLYIKNKPFIAQNKILYNLFLFVFFFLGIFNFIKVIPSIERFLYIGRWIQLTSVFLLITFLNNETQKIKIKNTVFKLTPLINIMLMIEILRHVFLLIGSKKIFSNIFLVSYFDEKDQVIGNILNFLN